MSEFESQVIGEALARLGRPAIVSADDVMAALRRANQLGMAERFSRISNANGRSQWLVDAGYARVVNSRARSDGAWVVGGKRVALYGRDDLGEAQRQDAAIKYRSEGGDSFGQRLRDVATEADKLCKQLAGLQSKAAGLGDEMRRLGALADGES